MLAKVPQLAPSFSLMKPRGVLDKNLLFVDAITYKI